MKKTRKTIALLLSIFLIISMTSPLFNAYAEETEDTLEEIYLNDEDFSYEPEINKDLLLENEFSSDTELSDEGNTFTLENNEPKEGEVVEELSTEENGAIYSDSSNAEIIISEIDNGDNSEQIPEDSASVKNRNRYDLEYNPNIDDNFEKGTLASTYNITYVDGVDEEVIFEDQRYRNIEEGSETPEFIGDLVREHYLFAGWDPEVSPTVLYSVVYTALWNEDFNDNGISDKEEFFTVVYKDGCNGEVFADQIFEGITGGCVTPSFSGSLNRPSYVFVNWTPDIAENVFEDAIYTALWEKDENNNGVPDKDEESYTVRYTDGKDGYAFEDQIYEGVLSGMPTPDFEGTPSLYGYVFWKWDPVFSATVEEDITYTAVWKLDKDHDGQADTVTITFKDGKNQTVFEDLVFEVVVGEPTPSFPQEIMIESGYIISEWNPAIDEYATEDKEYTAVWKPAGKAYAILTSGGYLVFFRSYHDYDASTNITVEDINGTYYTGQLYAGIEEPYTGGWSNWYNQRSSIRAVIVADNQTIVPTTMESWFRDCNNLTHFDANGFDTRNVTSMGGMFWGCNSLTSLDLAGFDTNNVTNMRNMFYCCGSLTNLNLSSFDTSNVIDMEYMFGQCSGLTSLDISSFDTSNVIDMGYMFSQCRGLTNLDISNFNTSNVTYMESMFYQCSKLSSLDLANFDTSNVADMGNMFSRCDSLASLNLSSFSTSNVVNMENMFRECSGLTSLDLSGFDTSNVTNMGTMFFCCSSLTSLNLSSFETSKVTNLDSIFQECDNLISLDLSSFDTRNVATMAQMFYGCNSLKELSLGDKFTVWKNNTYLPTGTWRNGDLVFSSDELYRTYTSNPSAYKGLWIRDLSSFAVLVGNDLVFINTNKVYDYGNGSYGSITDINGENYTGYVFGNIENTGSASPWSNLSRVIQTVYVAEGQTVKPKSMANWFNNCYGLTSFDASGFNTSDVTTMQGLFYACEQLHELNLSSFDTGNVTDMSYMFWNCQALTELNLESFNTSNVTDMSCMFAECYHLVNVNIGSFDTGSVTNMELMFANCNFSALDLSMFDTQNVTSMYGMFSNNYLTEINLSSFDTSKVTNMGLMFNCNSELTELNLNNFDTSNVTNMEEMFYGCSGLKKLDLSSFNTSAVTNMTQMFYGCKNIYELSLGEGFTVWRDNAYLPDGLWINGEFEITSSDLYNIYTTNTRLYKGTWIRKPSSYAVLVGTDLIFINGYTGITNGYGSITDINGTNYTGTIFEGIDDTGTSDPPWRFYSTQIERVYVAEGQTISPRSMRYWFCCFNDYYSDNLLYFDAKGFDTSNVTTMEGLFLGCNKISDLDLSSFDTSNVTDMVNMFKGCNSLEFLNISSFDTSNVADMSYMFYGCNSLESLNISSFDTSNVTDMSNMFYGCNKLREISIGRGFTKWLSYSGFKGIWENTSLGIETSSLADEYPSNAANWAGKWIRRNYDVPQYSWSEDNKLVTGTIYDSEWDEYITEIVEATWEVTKIPTCTETGIGTWTSGLFMRSQFAVQTKEVEIATVGHTMTAHSPKAATCTEDGSSAYWSCSICNKYFSDEKGTNEIQENDWMIPAKGHDWNAVEYEWLDNNNTVKATRNCRNDESHIETEIVGTTNEITTPATCISEGVKTYTSAEFINTAFSVQTKEVSIPAEGHDWDTATYEWSADNNHVTATRICKNDMSHAETETVLAIYSVITEATETTAGVGRYTSVAFENQAFAIQSKEIVLQPTGYEVTYIWDLENRTITGIAVSYAQGGETITENVSITYAVTKGATCTEKGTGLWTSGSFTNSQFAVQTKEVEIEAIGHALVKHVATAATCTEEGNTLYWSCGTCGKYYSDAEGTSEIPENSWIIYAMGHDYGHFTYMWSTDNMSVTANAVCRRDPSHVLTEIADITCSVTNEATCEEEGAGVYTASFANELFSTQIKEDVIPALGHDYGHITYMWNTDNMSVTASAVCRRDPSHVLTETADTSYSVTKEATCKEEGTGTYTTSFENDLFETQTREVTIAKTDHVWGEWQTTKQPTVSATGEEKRTCTICGEVETREIPKLNHADGWCKENGEWYYYVSGEKLRNGWAKDSQGWHWMKADGAMLCNGWAKDSKGWCWMDANGNMVYSKWIKYEGGWYYVKSSGYRASSEWCKDSQGWHWIEPNGRMLCNGWAKDSKGWCWVDADGNMIYGPKWIKYEGDWYYVKSSGYRAENEWCKDSQGWHWIGTDGKMLCNGWAKDSKGWCWVDANGNMIYGPKWIKYEGDWYYVKASGYRAENEWCKDSTGWHWIGADGKMLCNGWAKDSKGWCWLDENGNMATSDWIDTAEGRYYVNASGYRVTGEQTINGVSYTFDENGRLIQ